MNYSIIYDTMITLHRIINLGIKVFKMILDCHLQMYKRSPVFRRFSVGQCRDARNHVLHIYCTRSPGYLTKNFIEK